MNLTKVKEYLSVGIFTALFILLTFFSLRSILQIQGQARVVNYAGIVRGGTQKLIKEELNGVQDDALIARLTSIVENLLTGVGEHNLVALKNSNYLGLMEAVQNSWNELKTLIYDVRQGGDSQRLFDASQDYFTLVNDTVFAAEEFSEYRINKITSLLLNLNAVFAVCFLVWAVLAIRSSIVKARLNYDLE
jgi:nitrate/nitrite-specific signal transduction histidine kinase